VLPDGDDAETVAARFETTADAVRTANPGTAWRAGATVTVPLPFDTVFTDLPYGSFLCACVCEGLVLRYPFLIRFPIGTSVAGRRIDAVRIGAGPLKVGVNAAHHANEWITTPLVLLFLETYAKALASGGTIGGVPARTVYETATLTAVPLVNPDGADLVTGAFEAGDSFYESAKALAGFYPSIPFPSGWKANISGVDLNLGYPAGWENARAIKMRQGYTRPGPRDYVGTRPLEAPEDRAMYELTEKDQYDRTVAYHTQGGEIYWQYRDSAPRGSRALAERFATASGYAVADVPYESGFAGYKDWFIAAFRKSGFTVEAGRGQNPLPIADLPALYAQNEGLLVAALTAVDNT
jgi:g-D-glutamyl-meso-diaminopimelate peptidase